MAHHDHGDHDHGHNNGHSGHTRLVTAIRMAWSTRPSPQPPKGCGPLNGLSLCLWRRPSCSLQSSSCQAAWACWPTPFIISEMPRQPFRWALRSCLRASGPTQRFTFGYGRIEDLAGVTIVFTILFSAVVAGYESIDRFFHPQDISHLWAVAVASGIGFLGNEAVAIFPRSRWTPDRQRGTDSRWSSCTD